MEDFRFKCQDDLYHDKSGSEATFPISTTVSQQALESKSPPQSSLRATKELGVMA